MTKGKISLLVLGAVLLVIASFGVANMIGNSSTEITGNVIGTCDTAESCPIEDGNNRPVKEFIMESYTEVIDEKYYPQYSLKEITVNKGDLVRIKITDIKGSHNFNLDEFNIHEETPLNEETVIEFVADKSGEFVYYCTKPGHRAAGHWGTLIVK